jgi:hypothetical protein
MTLEFNENVLLKNTKTLTEIATLIITDCKNKPIDSIQSLQLGENQIIYAMVKNLNYFRKSYSAWLFSVTYQIGALGFIHNRSIDKLEQICILNETTIFVSLDGNKSALEKVIEANYNYNLENFDSDGYQK